jgi:hypothetical protein
MVIARLCDQVDGSGRLHCLSQSDGFWRVGLRVPISARSVEEGQQGWLVVWMNSSNDACVGGPLPQEQQQQRQEA